MQCSNCQAEIPDWHAYCPECCSLLQPCEIADEKQIAVKTVSHRAGRAGWILLPVFLGLFVIGALIVTAHEVKVSERPTPVLENSQIQSAAVTDSDSAKPTPTRRRDNLPAPKSGEKNPQPTPAAVVSEVSPPTAPPAVNAPAEAAATADAALEVEAAEEQISSKVGLLTIKSYTRARLYVDGQFSGYTPRTIKLIPGEHKISLLADGHEEWSRSVKLKGGQQTGIMASMEKKSAQ